MIKVEETRTPTNLEAIKSFENLTQARLPEEYKEWLLKYNGGHPTPNVYKLSEPINEKNNEISVVWFYALYDGQISNLINEFKYSRDRLPNEFIPIAYDYGGMICIGIKGEEYGKLYYWTTNWSIWSEKEFNTLYFIADSFEEFINGLYESEWDDDYKYCTRKYQDGTVVVEDEKHNIIKTYKEEPVQR